MQLNFKLLKAEHAGIEEAFNDFAFAGSMFSELKNYGNDFCDVIFTKNLPEDEKDNFSNTDVICEIFKSNRTIELTYEEFLYYVISSANQYISFDSTFKQKASSFIGAFKNATGVTKPAKRSFWTIFKR